MSKSYKKGAMLSSSLSITAKGIAFIQQLCIAYYFGVNAGTDIYFYLINITFLMGGVIQVITSSILIPRSMELRNNYSNDKEMKYLNSFLILIIGSGSILVILLLPFGKSIMEIITRFNSKEIEMNLLTFLFFLPVTLLMSINTLFAEILVSYRYFSAPILLNLGLNLSIIIFVVLFNHILGVQAMMFAAITALFIIGLIFIYYLRKTLKWQFTIYDFSLLRTSFKPMSGLFLNQCFVMFISAFPYYLLSQYQSGSVSIVNYAMKFIQAPYAFLQQFSIVMQVKMNELNVQKKYNELSLITAKMGRYIFLAGVLVSIVIFLLRGFIVEFFYGMGALSLESIQQIIDLIGIAIFSLPFIAFGQVWAKLYFTKQCIKRYVYTMITMNIFSCVVYYYFIIHYQIIGYTIAYALTETLTAIALWYHIKRLK